jgi:hypothetical protein
MNSDNIKRIEILMRIAQNVRAKILDQPAPFGDLEKHKHCFSAVINTLLRIKQHQQRIEEKERRSQNCDTGN